MKNYILFILLLCFALVTHSQTYRKTFSVSGGIYGDAYGGELTYNTNLSENTFTQIAINGTFTNFQNGNVSIPYYSVTGNYSYFFTILTLRSRREFQQKFSIGGGALAGYESANNGRVELTNIVSVDGKSKFIFGGVIALDLDVILTENISLMLKTSEFYHINSDFGKFTNYSGIGIRYYFN